MHRETLSGELSYKYKSVLGTVHSSLDYCRVSVDSAKRRLSETIVLKPGAECQCLSLEEVSVVLLPMSWRSRG